MLSWLNGAGLIIILWKVLASLMRKCMTKELPKKTIPYRLYLIPLYSHYTRKGNNTNYSMHSLFKSWTYFRKNTKLYAFWIYDTVDLSSDKSSAVHRLKALCGYVTVVTTFIFRETNAKRKHTCRFHVDTSEQETLFILVMCLRITVFTQSAYNISACAFPSLLKQIT